MTNNLEDKVPITKKEFETHLELAKETARENYQTILNADELYQKRLMQFGDKLTYYEQDNSVFYELPTINVKGRQN